MTKTTFLLIAIMLYSCSKDNLQGDIASKRKLYIPSSENVQKSIFEDYPKIESYFEQTDSGYSQIIYNSNTGGMLKLQIKVYQISDSVQKWSYEDEFGVPYTQLVLNNITGEVFENIEGIDPVMAPLGHIDTVENSFMCGKRSITECAKCVGEVCDEHWPCKILCLGMGAAICYGAHVTTCLLRKASGTYDDFTIPIRTSTPTFIIDTLNF